MATSENLSIDMETMDLSDEDLFALSDKDEETSTSRNPVEEHFLKELHDATERVERAKGNVDRYKELTDGILKKFHSRATCGESSGSDNESEIYQVTGEPVVKKKCIRQRAATKFLEVESVWQQVIEDKWIVGVVLKNTSNRVLEDPCLYVIVKDQPEVRGIVTFWEIVDNLSTRTFDLAPDVEKLVATVVLELPNFETANFFEAFGTISYILDDKHLQTPVPLFRLRASDVVDRSFAPKFSLNFERTVLAIKSISVERELVITLDKDSDAVTRLFTFLEDNGFNNNVEDIPDVYIAKNNEFFRHCIFEILPVTENEAPIRVSARSQSSLEVIVCLLREKFPEINAPEIECRTRNAAHALERELELELAGDIAGLHMARIITDLLIP